MRENSSPFVRLLLLLTVCLSGAVAQAATLIAQYHMDDNVWDGSSGELTESAGYSGGPYNGNSQGTTYAAPTDTSPALSGNPGTCGYAVVSGVQTDVAPFVVDNLPISTTPGAQTSVSLWMYWDGSGNDRILQFAAYDLRYSSTTRFGFNTENADIYGITTTSVASGSWHHIVAIFTNGSVTSNKLYVDGVLKTLSQLTGTPDLTAAVVSSTLKIGGSWGGSFRFRGRFDEVKVYNGALTGAEVTALYTQTHSCPLPLVQLEYKFNESSWSGVSGEVTDGSSNTYHGTAASLSATEPSTVDTTPAKGTTVGTCRYGVFNRSNKDYVALPSGFPNLSASGDFTITAWIRSADVSQARQRIFIDDENNTSGFGFSLGEAGSGKLRFFARGITSVGHLETSAVITNNTWYFVAATLKSATKTRAIYVFNAAGTLLTTATLTHTESSLGSDSGIASIGGETNSAVGSENTNSYGFNGNIDDVRVYLRALDSAQLALAYALSTTCAVYPHHLEVRHSSGSGLTCTPSTLTVVACADAGCTTAATSGVSGTLTATGGGMTVNWPSTAAFSIGSGSSSTTVDMQVTTAGSVLIGTSGLSPGATSATTCNFGSPSCTFTAASSGLLFNVPDHASEVSQSVTVSAVKSSDNSTSCTPAFASVSKSVLFKCTYTNPSTGTKPVRVGGTALNASSSAAAACDSTGQSLSLAFNASGVATTTVQYADVGQMGMTAAYTGSGADAGLSMTGSDSFIASPYDFAVSGITAGNLTAGNTFAATVTARNYAAAATPNFGQETSPEGATLSYVRAKPTGTGASNGTFTGSLGSFTSGVASSSALRWTEVGTGDVAAVLTSGSYLSSGAKAVGSSAGAVYCAADNATCTLPTGATATVSYGANGFRYFQTGVTGSISCSTGVFGDPLVGTAKSCYYVVTSGAAPGTTGTAGPFIPHHFDISPSNSCGSFTYSGQPFGVTVTARNASSATTTNYDGSVNTSPNYAKATTLSATTNGGTGSLSNTSLSASNFSAGVATVAASSTSPTFTFTTKLTTATSVSLRAVDTDSVSSSGYTEGSVALRSGRLKFSNAFGSEKASLSAPVQAQYWSSKAWVLNSADSCTSVPLAAVAKSNYLDYRGASTAAWSTTASAVAISAGNGTLTLTAPSPTATGSLDVAINLGSTTTDNACVSGTHATTTGANLSWLRSRNGNCAATYDRDPSARITFGVYSPESRKTVYVRELY